MFRYGSAIAVAACLYWIDYAWIAFAALIALVALCLQSGFAVRRWRVLWLAVAMLAGVIAGRRA